MQPHTYSEKTTIQAKIDLLLRNRLSQAQLITGQSNNGYITSNNEWHFIYVCDSPHTMKQHILRSTPEAHELHVTRTFGQVRQPTTSLHTWPITWDIEECLCLFKHHIPRHTPDWKNLVYFPISIPINNPTFEYRRKCTANWNDKRFSKLTIFWVVLVRTDSSL